MLSSVCCFHESAMARAVIGPIMRDRARTDGPAAAEHRDEDEDQAQPCRPVGAAQAQVESQNRGEHRHGEFSWRCARVVVEDAASARALAEERKATMVIWGKYDDNYVYPFVQVQKIPTLVRETVSVPVTLMTTADGLAAPLLSSLSNATQYFLRTPVTISNISFQSRTEEQVANLSTALLGVAFYANGDSARAQRFDRQGTGTTGASQERNRRSGCFVFPARERAIQSGFGARGGE